MSGFSCGALCQILCPPIPSVIAAKLAFMPPAPSYRFIPSNTDDEELTFTLSSYVMENFTHYVPDNLKATKSRTRRGNEIAIIYMPINNNSKLTFLLSHGNAVDLGQVLNFMYELGSKLNVNIMCYDYSGYGISTGKPLEKNLYADAECALETLRTKYSVPLEKIVLYGQSIGTVPTVYLATRYRVAAVVLHSPLTSGLRVAFSELRRNYCCDVFSNYTRAPHVISPTLIIHGTDDTVINSVHAEQLYERIPNTLEPLFIRGAGHNDCELFEEFLIRLEYLVHVELENPVDSDTTVTTVLEQNPPLRKRLLRFFHRDRDCVSKSISSRRLSGLTNSASESLRLPDESGMCNSPFVQPSDQSSKSTPHVWILKCVPHENGKHKKRRKSVEKTKSSDEKVHTPLLSTKLPDRLKLRSCSNVGNSLIDSEQPPVFPSFVA